MVKWWQREPNCCSGTQWAGEYTGEGAFQAGTIVRDGCWTMVANKYTTDAPAPSPTGPQRWLLDESPTWAPSQSTVSSILTGHRYTFSIGGWINGYRFWIPVINPAVTYTAILLDLTDPLQPQATYRPILPTSTGWNLLSLTSDVVFAGTVLEVLLQTSNHTTESNFTGNWNYTSSNGDVVPSSGGAHQRNNRDWIRFNIIDSDSVDRSSDLLSVVPGSEIEFESQVLEVIDVSPQSGYVEYTTVRLGTNPSNGLYNFSFDVPVPSLTDYVRLPGNWFGNPDIEGVFATDGGAKTFDDDAYGVDINIQAADVSDDWDLLAYSC